MRFAPRRVVFHLSPQQTVNVTTSAAAVAAATKWTFSLTQITTTTHLRQFLSHAIASGLLSHPTSSTNLRLLNTILQSFSATSNPGNALLLYDVMRRVSITPDSYTLPFALKAAARLHLPDKGRVLHAQSLKLGLESNVFVWNSLIHMYFVCGLVVDGRRLFDFAREVGVFDVVSWNSVISGYLLNDRCVEALRVFMDMVKTSQGRQILDGVTLVNALVGCGRIWRSDLGKEIHGYLVTNGFRLDFFLGSSLVDMYSKSGMIDDARKVFDEMPDRNVVCWTSMISGYIDAEMFMESVNLFRKMQTEGVKADDATVACVISACSHLGALDHGKWVHVYCDANGLLASLKVRAALIDMYSKCGDVKTALQVFHGSVDRDVYLWTAAICGLAMNGQPEEAVYLFSEMEMLSDVKPNEVTFLGILSACCHGGLVVKGLHYFYRMTNVYHLTPMIQHFGCIVDLLGRAKLLKEAEEFITKMPIKPDVVIWRSLLFAYRRHNDLEKAENLVQRIMEMEPENCAVHVLLSNVYASASKWADANHIRRRMRRLGIQKRPGYSFIELDGVLHEFLAEDATHSFTELIHETLLRMHDHILSEGHHIDAGSD